MDWIRRCSVIEHYYHSSTSVKKTKVFKKAALFGAAFYLVTPISI
jgi:hypothetical protein